MRHSQIQKQFNVDCCQKNTKNPILKITDHKIY